MLYKTIILELIQQNPEIHDQLASKRALPATLDRYTTVLIASHDSWRKQLSLSRPGSDPRQIESEALEIAIRQVENHLYSEFPTYQEEAQSLDDAMAFLTRHTPTA